MHDTTYQMRVLIIRTGDTTTCFGCGHDLPAAGQRGRGTSRFSSDPTVHLCSGCCLVEAIKGDWFSVAVAVQEARTLGPVGPARRRRGRPVF